MASSSVYVQLSPYLLLEYGYNDSTYIANQVKLSRIRNDYNSGQLQFLNGSASENTTQNVLDTSAANLGGYRWVLLDKDVPTPYISIDPKLVLTDMTSLLSSLSVDYDRVRVHILSGYRLENLEGLIIQVYAREAQTSLTTVLANNVYLNSDDRDVLNPRPILMGDRMYDRYIEFLVLSVKAINTDFYADPTNAVSIGYQYTTDNHGLLYQSQIYVKVFEINRTEKKNGILYLFTSDDYEVNLNQEDRFTKLVANVQEATDGDYFTYYPTFDGNFVEDFIADMNAQGGDYVVINDVDVYEQVGVDNLLTFSFSQVQISGFDGPLEYRPILKYASSAVTFSIDYTVRIYNKVNGFQIIRRASTTSYNPRKYGKQLEKIQLAQQSYPQKIYNKVYTNTTVNVIGNEYTTSFNTVYVPVFYNIRRISVQVKPVMASVANPLTPDFEDSTQFSQGTAMMYLSDFDTYYKFIVSQKDPKTGMPQVIDLSAGTVQVVFKDLVGNTISIQADEDDSSQANGELLFKIPGTVKKKVLPPKGTTTFSITVDTEGTSETLLYTGLVDSVENIGKEPARVKEIASAALNQASTVGNASVGQVSETSSSSTAASASPSTKPPIVSVTPGKPASILETLTQSNSVSVNATKDTPETKPVVIPGFSVDNNAQSVKVGLKPVSLKPEQTSQSNVTKNLSQSQGTKVNIKKKTKKK